MNWDTGRHQLDRSVEQLLGLATGMIADGALSNLEINYLSTWLSEHSDVASVWPGSVVAELVEEILSKGGVSEADRARLLKMLSDLSGSDFLGTGSVSAEVTTLPLDEWCTVNLKDSHICLSGEFLFGTRTKCEEVAVAFGSIAHATITKKIAYLVLGTKVSPSWAHTSFGRKIEQAIALQQNGHIIKIISERRWLEALAAIT